MSRGGAQQSLFFLGLPDLKNLCCVTLRLQEEDEELRSQQIKTCRDLVLLYSDILASPALDSFNEITVVMAIPFFQKGFLQMFGQRRRLQLSAPQCVFSGVLQSCLSYSLITRLSPSWNKAGLYLVSGKDFLTENRRLDAVSMELSTSQGQLCISIEANTVRLPPTTLEDFDLPPLVLRRFYNDPDSIIDPSSTRGAVWCHVLPSMKKGQIINISRQLPKDGPFRTYRDLQNHWSRLYGYRLPDLSEESVVYCSIYFRPVGQRLFTYPLSCVRLQPLQRCAQVDLQGALGSFLPHIRAGLQTVCGYPARLTSKPCYYTAALTSAAALQVLSAEQVNLTTSSSIRQVLTQLPAAPAPPPPPVTPSFGSQPLVRTPRLAPAGAQGLLGNGHGFEGGLTQSQECSRHQEPPSSFSSSCSVSSGYQSASSLSSSSSSSVLPPFPPPGNPLPKLVPIFKNKRPSRHVNVAQLRLQKQKEQLRGAAEEQRVTLLPSTGRSSRTSSLPAPHFNLLRKPQPSSSQRPQVHHVSSLTSRPEHGLIVSPQPETQTRTKQSSADGPSSEVKPAALRSSDVSRSEQGVTFHLKPKKSRSEIQDKDVEKMARSNQLSRLNSVTLSSWLRGRGVFISSKHRKEELMLKVMACLAEA